MPKSKASTTGGVRMFERATDSGGRIAINALYITKVEITETAPLMGDTSGSLWRVNISLAGSADVITFTSKAVAETEFDFWTQKAEQAK